MKNEYIKSPLNYTGGKYKLLQQIVPLLPDNINTFVDLFGGGFNVGININSNKVIYNDTCKELVDLLKNFYTYDFNYIYDKIIKTIELYEMSRSDIHGYEIYGCNSNDGLSNYNKLKYIKLRNDYNSNQDWTKFYTLIAYSFSNQIRFNSKNIFNVACGKRDFNSSLQDKLKAFIEELHNKEIYFWNKDFRYCNFFQDDFIYCDPPYYNSVANYNENNGWTEQDERDLLSFLDVVNSRGGKFALSNNLKYNNQIIEEWIKKYNTHYLNANYNNCNYHKKNKSADIEVLITNY